MSVQHIQSFSSNSLKLTSSRFMTDRPDPGSGEAQLGMAQQLYWRYRDYDRAPPVLKEASGLTTMRISQRENECRGWS
jgi:hypothetical protein